MNDYLKIIRPDNSDIINAFILSAYILAHTKKEITVDNIALLDAHVSLNGPTFIYCLDKKIAPNIIVWKIAINSSSLKEMHNR